MKLSDNNSKFIELENKSTFNYRTPTCRVPPLILNNNEILCVSEKQYDEQNKEPLGVYIYNIKKQKSTLLFSYNDIFSNSEYKELRWCYYGNGLNKNKNILIIYGSDNWVICIDIKLKKLIKKFKLNIDAAAGNDCRSLVVNNKLHIMGGEFNKNNVIINTDTLDIDEIYKFPSISLDAVHVNDNILRLNKEFAFYSWIYSKKRNIIFTFGGFDQSKHLGINMYLVNDKKWIKSNKALTNKYEFEGRSAVITRNDKYAILFGRWSTRNNGKFQEIHNIFIVDLDNMNVIKSNLIIPNNGYCTECILIDNYDIHYLLISGYLKQNNLNTIISNDIFKLILIFYHINYIYSFNGICAKWKIAVQDIIKPLYV